MRRRTTAALAATVILLTTAGAAGVATAADGTSTVPIGVPGDVFSSDVVLGDDAAYTLLPREGGDPWFESTLYVRSLDQGEDATALGDAVRVGNASGYQMAEHDGTLAYLTPDGRLALRAPAGTVTTPSWGATDELFRFGPSDMSSRWIAVPYEKYSTPEGDVERGGAIYDWATGARYDLMALIADELAGATDVYAETQVADGRAVWSVWWATTSGTFTGVYTVALGPDGPTGAVQELTSASSDLAYWVIDISEGVISWTEYTDETSVIHFADATTLAPLGTKTIVPPTYQDGDWTYEYSSTVFTEGRRLVTSFYRWLPGEPPFETTLEFDDPTVPGDEVTYRLPDLAYPFGANGRLVAYQDNGTGALYLTDVTGKPITDDTTPVPPAVSAVEPPSGSVLGGTRVTLRGTGFTGATGVTFGGVAGTDVQVVSSTTLQVTAPAGAAGSVPVVVTTPVGSSPAAAAARYAYTELVTQTPARGVADWTVPAGVVRCQQISGTSGVPDAATGVIVNVTTVRPTGPGYVVVYPDAAGTGATTPPGGSTVNFEPGADVANSAFVALPDNGKVCYTTRGAPTAGVLIDVAGFTLDGSGIVTQASQRLLDTRAGSHVGDVTGPVGPRQVKTVQVTGHAGVPADATAVILNVTATSVGSIGNLRVFPGGQEVPGTSVLNYATGYDKANATIVALGTGGTISFWSDTAGTAEVILDVVGYVQADSAYTGISPTRVLDTRPDTKIGPVTGPLNARQVYSVPVRGVGPVPAGATAVVLNVTAIHPTSTGNLRVYPDADGTGQTPPPGTSNINYIPGRDIPNQVVVALPANGQINFYNDAVGTGTVHLAVDVAGYITTPPPD